MGLMLVDRSRGSKVIVWDWLSVVSVVFCLGLNYYIEKDICIYYKFKSKCVVGGLRY